MPVISDEEFQKRYGGGGGGALSDDEFQRQYGQQESVAESAKRRLAARGINPDIPVDLQEKRKPIRFIDELHAQAERGPNPFRYVGAAIKGVAGLVPSLPLGNAAEQIPFAAGATEGANMARRVAGAEMEFPNDPVRRNVMKAAGALPWLGESAQNILRPSFVAPERSVTDDERLKAMEGTFTFGSLAAAKAKGVVPGGGDIGGLDPTRGVRQSLSTKTAPKIGRNLLQPKNKQMQFGADPGEFVVGMKTKRGEGVASYGPQIEAKLKDLNAQADQVAFNTPEGRTVPIDYEGALRQSFSKHITEAMRDGNKDLAARLEGVLDNEIAQLHKVTGGAGAAPARVGRRYQQDLGGQVTRFSPDPVDGTIQTARQEAWVNIKEQTTSAVPALKDINQQIHSGIEAKRALFERDLTESKGDPLPWLKHPIASTVAAIPRAASSPFVRSRLAAGMRDLAPVEAPPSPSILPNESVLWRPGVRRPANEQLALPPAPMEGPGGFLVSDANRMVGTRLGQLPAQDAAVFAPQNRTAGMRQEAAPPPRHQAPPTSAQLQYLRDLMRQDAAPVDPPYSYELLRQLERENRATRAQIQAARKQ